MGTLIFAAIGVVVQLKAALNAVWEAEPPSTSRHLGLLQNLCRLSSGSAFPRISAPYFSTLLTTSIAALGTLPGWGIAGTFASNSKLRCFLLGLLPSSLR